MNEIGGYFEWELGQIRHNPHAGADMTLTSGRSCLAILLHRVRPRRVVLPYYICDGVLEPFHRAGVAVTHYALDENLEIAGGPPDLSRDERMLYVNYFGLKSEYVSRLEERYEDRLWVDNVQAFFDLPQRRRSQHFNSARKFFGVPDGAHLYLSRALRERWGRIELPPNSKYLTDHLTLRLAGRTEEGLATYRANERLIGGDVAAISKLGRAILDRIDYATAAERRRSNYSRMHAALGGTNRLPGEVLRLDDRAVPFCYPYVPDEPIAHEVFWRQGIFPPVLWDECARREPHGYRWEKLLARECIPLPIDQRYGSDDIDRVVQVAADEHRRTHD